MANDKTTRSAGDHGDDKIGVLKEFQDAVMGFITKVPEAIIKAAGNDPDVELVKTNLQSIQNIFKKSFVRINSEFATVGAVTQQEVVDFLEITDGTNLARTAEKAGVAAFGKKLFGGKIWQWIGQNITEIKKIIGMILGLFSKKLERWWNKIKVLIDQLFNLVMSLLSSIFGFNSVQVARELSLAEVNHLNEMAALARLESASSYLEDEEG